MAYGEVTKVYGVRDKQSGGLVRGGNSYGYKTEGIAKSALTQSSWKGRDWAERFEVVELIPKDTAVNKEYVLALLAELEAEVQFMREEGDPDLRTVLYHIRNATEEVSKFDANISFSM